MKKLALFLPLLAWLLAGCTPAVKPQLGFFYNEDGTFSPGFDSIRQPQGIVFDMKAGADSSWCYVLSLQEFNLPLTDVSSVLDGVASPDSLCGEENTKVWVKSLGKDSPIVNRMRSMGKEWFVPSVGDWRLLRKSYDRLFAMLDTVPQARQIGMNNYWSSTPEPDPAYPHYGITYDLYGDRYADSNKSDSCLVRFMLRVKLDK